MKRWLMIVPTLVLLVLAVAGPASVAARDSRRTPTPTPTAAAPTPTPTPASSTPTPTPAASTPTATPGDPTATPTPQPLVVITAGFDCTNGACELGPGNVGTFFNGYVTSSGGQGPTPYKWKLVSGSLPSGMSMTEFFGVYSTQISGTPTQVQVAGFTLQVTDGQGHTARQAFTLTIDPPLPLVITSGDCCRAGTVGTAYRWNLFADGGVRPYTWSIPSGQLPPGLSLDRSPPAGIEGTPTTRGTFTFTVRVTDNAGAHTDQPGSITIN